DDGFQEVAEPLTRDASAMVRIRVVRLVRVLELLAKIVRVLADQLPEGLGEQRLPGSVREGDADRVLAKGRGELVPQLRVDLRELIPLFLLQSRSVILESIQQPPGADLLRRAERIGLLAQPVDLDLEVADLGSGSGELPQALPVA